MISIYACKAGIAKSFVQKGLARSFHLSAMCIAVQKARADAISGRSGFAQFIFGSVAK